MKTLRDVLGMFLIGLLTLASSRAHADVMFLGTSADLGGFVNLSSVTGFDEVAGFPSMRLNVLPFLVTLSMTQAVSVTANSFIGEDTAAIGFLQLSREIAFGYSSSGPRIAILSYSIDIGGSFSGEGDIAAAQTKITGNIGGIASHVFTTEDSEPSDGNFNKLWNITPFVGSIRVSPDFGTFVPNFQIANFDLQASSVGFATMTNTWSSARMIMSLTQVPEPPSVVLVGTSLLLLLHLRKLFGRS